MSRPTKKSSAGVPAVRSNHIVCGQAMEAVYQVAELRPKGEGPWQAEAEKIAWTDPKTGFGCIIRREPGGHLGGYVSIGSDHPLFGFDARAIPRTVINVHGGLNYAERCDESGPEELSICHVVARQAAHDDRWWIGFSCDGLADFIPSIPRHATEAEALGIEQTYRDQEYVFARCTDLAAQLAAVAANARGDG